MNELDRIVNKVKGLLEAVYATEKPELTKLEKLSLQKELLEDRLLELSAYLQQIGNEISCDINKIAAYLEKESWNIRYLKGAEQYAKEAAEKHPEGGRILSLVEKVETETREKSYEEFTNFLSAVKSFTDAANRLLEAFAEYGGPSEVFQKEMQKLKNY